MTASKLGSNRFTCDFFILRAEDGGPIQLLQKPKQEDAVDYTEKREVNVLNVVNE